MNMEWKEKNDREIEEWVEDEDILLYIVEKTETNDYCFNIKSE